MLQCHLLAANHIESSTMAYRYGGRLGVNQENEQRRLQREPVVVWKKEWVLPSGSTGTEGVKILKWVRNGDSIKFDQFDDHFVGEETIAAMEIEPEPELSNDLAAHPLTESIHAITTPPAAVQGSNPDALPSEQMVAAEGAAVALDSSSTVPAHIDLDSSKAADAQTTVIESSALPPVEIPESVADVPASVPAATTMADVPIESERSALDAPTIIDANSESAPLSVDPSSVRPPELL